MLKGGIATTVLCAAVWLTGCPEQPLPQVDGGQKQGSAQQSSAPASVAKPPPAGLLRLVPKVVASYPHDPGSFTQGLVWADGRLYESAGQYGASNLREVELESGRVLRRVDLAHNLFAEGLALVPPGELIQLTWREGVALRWDTAAFDQRGVFEVTGEGWGLCFDGSRLVMSDGSDQLFFRDPQTFAVQGQKRVTLRGRPLKLLNELECVDGMVYANVWQTDLIVRIDPASGIVNATIDAAGLLSPREREGAEVLNGIAWVPERKVFLLTGKLWPKLFAVELVEAP